MCFNQRMRLALFQLLVSTRCRMRQPVFPCSLLIGEGSDCLLATAALPLILRDVHNDAVQISGHQGLSVKAGQRAIEPKEDLLRKVVYMLLRARQPHKRAEDTLLVIAHDRLEIGVDEQGPVRPSIPRKVSATIMKLSEGYPV